MRYRLNEPQVIAETVAGETIVVNLGSGHYFSLQGTAVEIWNALLGGAPVPTVVAGLESRYDAADGEIEAAVSRFVEELTGAELIVPATGGDGSAPAQPPVLDADASQQPWAAPTLSVFTDMQDIILLDPVHEVDERGWPHAPAAS